MSRATAERTTIAVLAKAPQPGIAKTRLIPALGAEGAAALQGRLIERAVATACAAAIGPVTLWTTPDEYDPVFVAMREKFGATLARQPDGVHFTRAGAVVPARLILRAMARDYRVLRDAAD